MPLGRSSGIVSSKSTSQPASSRSSRWKWMAPYSLGSLAPVGLVAREVVPGDGAGRHVGRRAVAVVAGDVGDAVGRHVEAEVPRPEEVARRWRRARPATPPGRPVPSSSRARPISRGRSSRPSKWRVRRSPSIEAASTSASASSAIGPPPDASRCVTSRGSAPGSRQGMWLTDARPASTVSATKYQPQRGSGIPVAIADLRAATPDDRLERPVRRDHQRPAVAIERVAAARDDLLAPPGVVGWTKTANVKSPRRALPPAPGSRVRAAPDRLVAARPASPSIADGTRTCLKPGPAGFVSPWISRTSRLSYSVVIRADHELDRLARRGAQPVRVAEQAQHRVGRRQARRVRATASSNAATNPCACSIVRDGWIDSRMNGLPRVSP